jgi:tRNA pseudouridine13 synthase
VAPAPAGSKPEQSPITSVEKPSEGTQKPAFVLSSEDDKTLVQYFGAAFKDELVKFHEKILAKPEAKPAVFGSLLSSPITDRVLRGQIHQNIRRIFDSKIETTLIEDDVIKFTAALPVKPHPEGYVRRQNPRQQRSGPKGKLGWQELGGEYLHFSLYKENKNTLEVTSFLSRKLHVKPKEFGFAGTKDRRAATVQRVSIKRQYADRLASLNRELRNARVGDFKYEKHGLELGDLQGNEFTITLRDCHFGNDFHLEEAARVQFANDVVGQAVEHLKVHGFINYFGLQRFGTFDIGTDEVGKKILKEDYEGAVWAILSFNEEILAAEPNPEARGSDKIASDFIYRARAIDLFKKTGKYQSLPQAFSAEQAIIRHLSSGQKSKDYLGAIMAITRNMRTLYPHAYQSLVWNTVASERWSRYRDRVIKGDLVIVDTEAKKAAARQDEVDENGEVVVHPAEDDVGLSHEDLYQRARPLTAEEADSGRYTIFDIVLPTPGFDVEYPDNDIGDFYKEFMGSERGGGLDPAKMRRNQKDFSLSGSYRKFLGQVGKNLSFQIRTYHEDTEQLVETDLDRLNKSRPNYQRYGSQYQNSGPQNGRGRGARYDNSAGQHGGRQNGNWSNQQNGPNNDNAQQPPPSTGSTSGPPTPAVHPNLAAWQSLPAKLAADDAAAAAAYELRKPANPDDIKQPIYKETFVETSVINNEGRRTGYRSTKYIGADGQELTKEEADAINAANAKIDAKAEAMELDASNAALNAATLTSAETPTPAPGLPRKRSAGDMSSAAAEPAKPMGLSMDGAWDSFEYRGPAKIGVIIKFTLGPSMYATMALRELMKAGGVKTYKPDFSSGA